MRLRWACAAASLGLGIAACSSDLFHSTDWTTICASQPNTNGCPGADAGNGGGGGSGAGTSTGGSDAGADAQDAADAGPPPDCATYCGLVTSNCDGPGADGGANPNQQYATLDQCMSVCSELQLGAKIGGLTDTIGCRQLFATDATKATGAALATNCVNAGPSGGGKCSTTCDAYCKVMTSACAGTYTDATTCMTACKAFPNVVPYSTGVQSGPDVSCHLYFAVQAIASPMMNCALAGAASMSCK